MVPDDDEDVDGLEKLYNRRKETSISHSHEEGLEDGMVNGNEIMTELGRLDLAFGRIETSDEELWIIDEIIGNLEI